VLPACQSTQGPETNTAVSLEQAKALTAEFQDVSFVPPARTVDDIVTALGPEKEVPEDCESRRVEQPLLETLYSDHNAVRLSVARRYMQVAVDELFQGRYQNSVKFAKEGARIYPPSTTYYGTQSMMFSALSRYYAMTGDFDAARSAWRKGKRVPKKYRSATHSGISKSERKIKVARIETQALTAEAAILQLQGRYQEAEQLYRDVLTNRRSDLRSYIPLHVLQSDLAEVVARQGRYAEAEAIVRDALASSYVYLPRTAYHLLRLSQIMYAQGRYQDTETLARRVINIYEVTCAPRGSINLALGHQLLAESMAAQGRWQEALEEFDAIQDAVLPVDPDTFERRFKYSVDWGLALLNTDQPVSAVKLLDAALIQNQKRFGDTHYSTAESHGMLGIALARTNQDSAALTQFQQALPVILAHRREIESEAADSSRQDRRTVRILEAYLGLLIKIRGTQLESSFGIDSAALAFELAQLSSMRSVQRALSASSARAAARDPKLSELARQEQDAQRQIGALNDLIAYRLSLPPENQEKSVIDDLRQDVTDLRNARKALIEKIENEFPEYADLINPKAASVVDAQDTLKTGEALVSTYVTDSQTYVWAIPESGEVEFTAIDMGREELARMVGRLRASLDPQAETLGDIPDFDLDTAYQLYRRVLQPVDRAWKNASTLLTVGHGPLGQLPLSVLTTAPEHVPDSDQATLFSHYRDVPWLARTHGITSLPSVASLKVLRGASSSNQAEKLYAGFGDPWFSEKQAAEAIVEAQTQVAYLSTRGIKVRSLPVTSRAAPVTRSLTNADMSMLPRLRETADEVRNIAEALGADPVADVFLGKQASESIVRSMNLNDRRVIVFATHGLVSGDLNGLTQPALALSSPDVTGEQEDGLLTMGEVLGLKLNADWVVLSACNTSAADGAGAEAVSGLGRAFFYAGAKSLLVTHWPVETTSAKALTTGIFTLQSENPSLSRSETLRQAMMHLIDGPGYVDSVSGQSVFSYAHPIFWAPFSLIGDGG
jgi:CHAT domain-containing protein